jgi:hypothetical protein
MTDARIRARSSLVVGPLRLRAQADCKLEGKKVRRSTNAITAHICASFAISPSNFLTFTSDPILRRAILRYAPNGRPVSVTGRGLARLWSAVACYRFRRRGLPRRAVFLACCRAFRLRPFGCFAPYRRALRQCSKPLSSPWPGSTRTMEGLNQGRIIHKPQPSFLRDLCACSLHLFSLCALCAFVVNNLLA